MGDGESGSAGNGPEGDRCAGRRDTHRSVDTDSDGGRIDRQRVEARLDHLIHDNRFTIAVVFPAVGAVLLIASREGLLPGLLSYNPLLILLGTLVMRSPLLAGIFPLIDRRSLLGLVMLVAYAYLIEVVGVLTGLPYGEFSYTVDLGPMLFGLVPVGLPIFFVPLVLNSYLLCLLLLGERADRAALRLPVVIATVLAIDLVLDPGAVVIGFWTYPEGGFYYGVPWTNYAGWVLSATVSVGLLDWGFARSAIVNRLRECEFMLDDLVSFVILWGGINLLYTNWIPVAIAALLAGGLVRTDRFDFRVLVPGRFARGG